MILEGGITMPDTATVEKTVKFLSEIEIEAKARALREKFGMDTIPVRVIAIADKLGIGVRGASWKRPSIAGMIGKREGKMNILYRKTDPEIRSRFTIAHELGHFVLHLSDDLQFVDEEVNLYRLSIPRGQVDSDTARREIQANAFAASLLMPERQLRGAWELTHSIGNLARFFKVSRQAMGIRVAALGLE
jgi:Zn-dependent peptidase ImmA (M78 family)